MPVRSGLDLSADPHFRGDDDLPNPEQLLVLAASSCQLLSFLAVAARAGVDVVGYEDDAVEEMSDGVLPQRITRITLRPRVTVAAVGAGAVDEKAVHELLQRAHDECYIANSLTTEVVLEPVVVGGAL